jgi:hypothetical protein
LSGFSADRRFAVLRGGCIFEHNAQQAEAEKAAIS